MVSALEHIFELSLQNSLVTYLTGATGSGKSHTILHLQHRSRIGRSRIVVVVNANLYDPHDRDALGQRNILAAVHTDNELRTRAKLAGLDLSPTTTSTSIEMLADEVNRALDAIGSAEHVPDERHAMPFGLVIAIDGLDEWFRPLKGTVKFSSVAEQLVLNVRFLLDTLLHSCIMLSLTTDIFEEVMKVVPADRTFLRRFIPPQEFNGTELAFGSFNMEEARQLYARFREMWLRKARDFGLSVEKVEGRIDWPISSDAVELARNATTARPGPLQGIFQSAFETLQREHPRDWLSSSIFVDLRLMAEVVSIASLRAEHGVDLAQEQTRRQVAVLAEWDKLTSSLAEDPTPVQLADAVQGWLETKDFGVKRGTTRIPSGTAYTFVVADRRNSGTMGLLPLLSSVPTKDDIQALNAMVTMGEAHQILIVTKQEDFNWVYARWGKPVDYDGPWKHDLSNYSYVLQLTPEQLKGVSVVAQKLPTQDGSAALWAADRLCSPIEGYRLSDILACVARNAIGNANL